ncbi:MAG TPA: radical SAM protein [Nitrospirota bacterium]|nr:radical SAM protein [Nitrospirota bacterium]
MSVLLIYPPVAKPSEPPAGIAKLKAVLSAHDVPCGVLDANIEGLLWLLNRPLPASDTWTRRAARNVTSNIAALRDFKTYRSPDTYSRTVGDLQRVLSRSCGDTGALPGLADLQHERLSPHRSGDLIAAAEHPEQDPFYPYFCMRLTELIGQHQAAMIGFSLTYLSQALSTFAMIGFIKKNFPRVKIVLGGGLVTSWGARNREERFSGLVDHVITGPGEKALLALSGAADEAERQYLPDYSGLPLDEYLSPGRILPYSASNGCWWRKCSFCPETAENNPYFPLPAKQIASDFHVLAARHRPALIHLIDNALSVAHLQVLVNDPPGVPWYGFARITRELADPEFCADLRSSGCVMLQLGLESGDQGVLDALGKGIDLAVASKALRNLKQAGIATYVYLLFGTPAESEEEAKVTLEFTSRHSGSIDFLNLAIFNMPLCGEEAGEHGTGRFSDGDLSLYTDFRHPRGWDRKAVRLFLDREFKRHPAVASILKNDPPIFTSNHAAFFRMGTGW